MLKDLHRQMRTFMLISLFSVYLLAN